MSNPVIVPEVVRSEAVGSEAVGPEVVGPEVVVFDESIASSGSLKMLETPSVKVSSSLESLPLESFPLESCVQLACSVSFYPEHILFSHRGMEIVYPNEQQLALTLQALFPLMNGTRTIRQIQQSFHPSQAEAILGLIKALAEQGLLIEHAAPPEGLADTRETGEGEVDRLEVRVMEIRDRLANTLFWQALQPDTHTSPSPHLFYGFALELRYFLAHQSAFQAPLLDFQASAQLRRAWTQLHRQGQGQIDDLTEALAAIEIESGPAHLPLPETVSLLNALAFWAHTEPLFALSLQGVLTQSLAQILEIFASACLLQPLNPKFVAGIEHCIENSHSCYSIPVDVLCQAELRSQSFAMRQRFVGQFHLFVELYCNWLEAIGTYYSAAPQLQRNLDAIVGEVVSVERPRLRDGVWVQFLATGLEIRDGQQGIAITVPVADQLEMQQLVRCLQAGGFSRGDLAQACPRLRRQIAELLSAFEAKGWLRTEVCDRPLSGSQFYREISHFLAGLKSQFPPSVVAQRMMEGTITREQLMGYVLESYHVTHLCPRLLAPALSQFDSPKSQVLLQNFFTSELHHDQLIEKSLKSVGITPAQIQTLQPLPMTFAVCSSLGVWARQHSLSFKSALMLFEEDDQAFHQLFKQCCADLDLPTGFYQPILLHAHVNEDGEHDQITRLLLDEVAYVSIEEQGLVKQNLATLLTSMVLRTQEIIDYYGDPSNPMPRCFRA